MKMTSEMKQYRAASTPVQSVQKKTRETKAERSDERDVF
jgi:hypothetical protein